MFIKKKYVSIGLGIFYYTISELRVFFFYKDLKIKNKIRENKTVYCILLLICNFRFSCSNLPVHDFQ